MHISKNPSFTNNRHSKGKTISLIHCLSRFALDSQFKICFPMKKGKEIIVHKPDKSGLK
jgi:hypothetical protein